MRASDYISSLAVDSEVEGAQGKNAVPKTQGRRAGDVAAMEPIEIKFTEDPANGLTFSIAPEERERIAARGPIGFGEQMRRTDKTELFPFNPESMVKGIELLDAVNRLRDDEMKGETLVGNFLEGSLRFGPLAGIGSAMQTPFNAKERREKDIAMVIAALQTYEEEAIRGRTWGAKVGQGVAMLPGFMAEFVATGGLAAIGKQGVYKVVEKGAKEAVKKGALNFTTRAVGVGVGAGARTAAMPHRLGDNYAKRQLEAGLEVTNKGIKLLDEASEKPHVSALRAFGDVYIENFSEVLGGPGRRITSKFIPKKAKKSFENMYKALGRQKGVTRNAADLWSKVGFDGFLEELGEERAGAFLRALFNVDDFGAGTNAEGAFGLDKSQLDGQRTWDRILASFPNWEELGVEAGIFAFPMALRTGTAETMNVLAKRRAEQRKEEKKQETKEIKEISASVADKLAAIGQEREQKEAEKQKARAERAEALQKKAEEKQKKAEADTRTAKERAKERAAQRDKTLEENRKLKAENSTLKKAGKRTREILNQIGKGVDHFLGEISTRVGNISIRLKDRLRKFEFDTMLRIAQDQEAVMPFIEGMARMTQADRADLDLALKNGWVKQRDALLEKYDLKDQYAKVRETLDNLYERAKEAGLKADYLTNHHPRAIKDIEGLVKFFEENDIDNTLQDALLLIRNDLGEQLTEEQKAELLNQLLRGKASNAISLNEPSALKDRKIKELDGKLNQFYYSAEASLLHYIFAVNNAVETNKFFGQSKTKPHRNLEDSIGALVTELILDGDISMEQQQELTEVLKARFTQQGTRGVVTTFKNISYATILGSPVKALTQLGDLALAAYKNGFFNTLAGVLNLQPVELSRKDIGVAEIGVEFEEGRASHAFVKKVFDLVGFTGVDSLGKNALIRGSYLKNKQRAERGDQEFLEWIDRVFENEAQEVLEDFKNDRLSENVKYLLAADLMDIQPITLSEMPAGYNVAGNGRIFYMLKSFTIKQLDIWRNDVFKQLPKNPAKAIGNMMKLTAAMIIGGAGPDFLKDLILGRPLDSLPDAVFNNLLKIVGFNKFLASKAAQEGPVRTGMEMFLPPTKMFDDAFKDIRSIIKNGEFPEKWEFVNSIPVGGELYYWWFGKGRTKVDSRRSKGKGSRASKRRKLSRGRSRSTRRSLL